MSVKKSILVLFLAPLFLAGTAAVALPEKGDTVDVARFLSGDMKNGVPAGWKLEKKSGTPVIGLEKEGNAFHLNMKSDPQSSFGIKKAISVNVKEYPFLNWKWMVSRLPRGGDVRKAETDDQAIQIYIAFYATGFPAKFHTPVIGYVWDNEAPRDWTGRSRQFGGSNLRYIVLKNKTDKIGEWYNEKRDIYQDYRKLFKDMKNGEPAGPAEGISLYINSQHTRSTAESNIADVYFSRQ
ncbi:MAG: DUF3047 domain-containing protein [Deltaproteobacteria bacterium]|nr:DUF3047 domain-containing protein [Deltaproteobacteria bacterium]